MKTRRSRSTVLVTAAALLWGLGLPSGATANEAKDCRKSTFPATGQTTPYTADTLTGFARPVPDDGTVRAGGPLRYRDNGDGTITDLNTRLMWEKKSIDGSLHDVNLTPPWSAVGQMTIWDWLAAINTEGGTGFAGHSDWRIPNVKELQSLVDYSVVNSSGADSGPDAASVAPIFNMPGMFNGCTLQECSVTSASAYVSSTHTGAGIVNVTFSSTRSGMTSFGGDVTHVRAVRGGCVD